MARPNPGWNLWLAWLEATLDEVGAAVWTAAVPQPNAERPADAPLLAGATVYLPQRAAQAWVQRLLHHLQPGRAAAGTAPTAAALRRFDAVAFLEAAIGLDEARLEGMARSIALQPALLGAMAQLAAMPLLQACGQSLAGRIPTTWPHGYCPVCGDWGTAWLRCPYCGESDHRRLGELVTAEGNEARKVATCLSCKGYVKTLTTLQASPSDALALDDLATIDLDIAALEHGYTRPQRPGYAVGMRVLGRHGRLHAWFRWRL
jgi:FdhE protein